MCVNSAGQLWQWIEASGWIQIQAPKLKMISISSTKQAVAIDFNGQALYKNFQTPAWNWSYIGQSDMKYIDISKTMIVGVNNGDEIFYIPLV